MSKFIGRIQELEGLRQLTKKRTASLVIINGRRRIGKTRLAEKFGEEFTKYYVFTGLAPSQASTSQDQRTEFLRQMLKQGLRGFNDTDWGNLFDDLALSCKKGKILIVLDEISWMGHGDHTFLAKLKNAWDLGFKKNPNLILIISGSNSTWIEENILNSTGFVGRISYRLTLEELSLKESNHFWGNQAANVSAYDKLKLLSITGGVPRYLEEIDPSTSAENNIKRLCFKKEGLLFREFEDIFADSLSKRSEHYKIILRHLADGPADALSVAKAIGRDRTGGDVLDYLEDLCGVGYVTRDYTWDLITGKESKISRYRVTDNYVRFYLKFIEPNQKKILSGTMHSLPVGWDSIMGLQFENLVIGKSNRHKIYELLGIPLDSLLQANPYFQTQTLRRKSCQCDFIIQTKDSSLYILEIKFQKEAIGSSVISEMKEKIIRLQRPIYTSCRPILIHINGITEAVKQNDYFVKVIDFSDFLL